MYLRDPPLSNFIVFKRVGNGKKSTPSIAGYFSRFCFLRPSDVQPGTIHQYLEILGLAIKLIVHTYDNMPNKSALSRACGALNENQYGKAEHPGNRLLCAQNLRKNDKKQYENNKVETLGN